MAYTGRSGQTFYGRYHTAYTLDQFIKKGGEGEVYGIKGYPEKVAKLYTSQKFKPTQYISDPKTFLREKIETMLDNPVQTHLNGHLVITWPTDLLKDASGQFVGYVMPRVHVDKSLLSAQDTYNRTKLFPNFTWRTGIGVAYNLAQVVDLVHSKGYVIGDMNEMNFLVDPKGHITIIDTDSFNIVNKKTNKVYKCGVGIPEMIPPELQGRNFSRPSTVFTEESDNFGLAIHIFKLLMNGVHPFGAVPDANRASTPSVSNGAEVHNITNGICPYVTGGSGNKSSFAPDPKMMPLEIRNLFDRAFKYTAADAAKRSTAQKRPKAWEWCDALGKLLKENFVTCSKNSSHMYLKSYGKCPWCEVANAGRLPGIKKIIPPIPVPPGPKKPGSSSVNTPVTPNPVRRSIWTLSAACIGTGMVISPFLAQYVIPWIGRLSTWWLPLNYVMIGLSLLGGMIGYGISFVAEDKYVSAYNAVPWLLLSILSPILACLCAVLLSGVFRLAWLLILLVLEILKWVLIIAILLVCCGAFA